MITACFAYPNGTTRQNDKSTDFHYLNKDFQSNSSILFKQLPLWDVLLNTSTKDLLKKYSALARRVLGKCLSSTNIRL